MHAGHAQSARIVITSLCLVPAQSRRTYAMLRFTTSPRPTNTMRIHGEHRRAYASRISRVVYLMRSESCRAGPSPPGSRRPEARDRYRRGPDSRATRSVESPRRLSGSNPRGSWSDSGLLLFISLATRGNAARSSADTCATAGGLERSEIAPRRGDDGDVRHGTISAESTAPERRVRRASQSLAHARHSQQLLGLGTRD